MVSSERLICCLYVSADNTASVLLSEQLFFVSSSPVLLFQLILGLHTLSYSWMFADKFASMLL